MSSFSTRRTGAWFTQWMETRRFTIKALAKRLGVSENTIGNWRCTMSELPTRTILALDAIDEAEIKQRILERESTTAQGG